MVTSYQWVAGPVPDGLAVRQVYGYCFDDSGLVLLRTEDGSCTLPGGTPEPGEDDRAVLERECMEESQITLGTSIYLGYQQVSMAGRAPFAQLRFAARIAGFLPRQPDPDTGRTYGRLLTQICKAPALLDWGVHGLLQAADAARAAYHLGVDPDARLADIWRN